jgi:hypothetical protein
MKIYKFLILLSVLAVLSQCKQVEYEMKTDPIGSVTNLQAVKTQDNNVVLSWTLPAATQPLNVVIYQDGAEVTTLNSNATTYTVVNPEVNKDHLYTVKVKTANGIVSEGVTSHITLSGTNPVSNLTAERKDGGILLKWNLPVSNAGTEVEVLVNGQKATIASDNTYTIPNASTSTKYTIGVRTKGTTGVSHYIYTEVNSIKLGMVITAENIAGIADDDEKAAAEWFVATYPESEVIPVSKIKANTVALSDFGALWIHIDRNGTGALPAELLDNSVIARIQAFYKNGGGVLFSVHATQYIANLGRIPANRKPGIIGAGTGGVGTDTWTTNYNIGMVNDNGNHPLFSGLPKDPQYFAHPTIPLIGPGHREDHNSMWDLNSYGYAFPAAGANVVDAFQKENKAVDLSTWGHVTDFCCAGIIEFQPKDNFKGKAIAIGLAAYEWKQNSGVNLHQANIERLTKNAFEFLTR